MAQGAKQVAALLIPSALEFLAQEARKLLSGEFYEEALRGIPGDEPPIDTITSCTYKYCVSNFASIYGYYYRGASSKPPNGTTFNASQDIMVWSSSNGVDDVKSYLQTQFQSALEDEDSIQLSDNLSDIFKARFKETDLHWTPYNKRYIYRHPKYTTYVDTMMVTATGTDAKGKPMGLASFCWVGWNPNSS
ncbi:hypothetical protein [Streptomyces albidoflavus]|uniref:hypothetical protein n=1 Tax=Streptomyces albidoflavus TaxID=1886 RepID=UPI0033E39E67